MMLRVPRIATRAWDTPHPYGFPTFRLVLATYSLDQAIIEIPDDEIAQAILAATPVFTNVPTIGNVVTGIDMTKAASIVQAIRQKYLGGAYWTPSAPA